MNKKSWPFANLHFELQAEGEELRTRCISDQNRAQAKGPRNINEKEPSHTETEPCQGHEGSLPVIPLRFGSGRLGHD